LKIFPSVHLSENRPFLFLENAGFCQPFQVIIPSGANCSQAAKRPSGANAA
jgi:hypothetical protein